MKVFIDKVQKISDYNEQSKWIDYQLLIYLMARFQ